MIRKLQYEIGQDFDKKQVQVFLRAHGFSSRMIKDLKKNPHGILIGNKKCTALKLLKKGDRLTVYIKETNSNETIVPFDFPLDIVYEDKDVAVVNKPPFMATHPSQNNRNDSLANALRFHFDKNGQDCAIRPVNRLDKNTSGLILVAKNAHASGVLSNDLKAGRIQRTYLAFVEGAPECDSATITAPIARQSGSTIKRQVDFEKGERAITHLTVLKRGEFSLLHLKLDTGKTHQIRVHMSHIGHAVCGDFLYGTEFSGGINRHALHSYTLTFIHPITNEQMFFKADLPEDMKKIYSTQWGTDEKTISI